MTTTRRPEYRTSNGTPLKRVDSATTDHRPAPYGWDPTVHGPWPPQEEADDAGSLAATMNKLDAALDKLSDTLEQKEAEQSRARLRARFGLDDDNREDDSLRRKIFGDSL